MLPDLNPVEHLWGISKRKLEHHNLSNKEQLKKMSEEWQNICPEICATLVSSMLRSLSSNIKVDIQSDTKFESQ